MKKSGPSLGRQHHGRRSSLNAFQPLMCPGQVDIAGVGVVEMELPADGQGPRRVLPVVRMDQFVRDNYEGLRNRIIRCGKFALPSDRKSSKRCCVMLERTWG